MGAACPGVPGPSGDKSEIRHYPAASFFVFFFSVSSFFHRGLLGLSRRLSSRPCWVYLVNSRLSDSPRWVSGRVGSISSLVQAIGSVAIFRLSDSPRWVSLSSLGLLGLSSLV